MQEHSPGVFTTTLKDAKGVEHVYLIPLHPAEEGADIMFRLVPLALGPLGTVLAGMLDGDKRSIEPEQFAASVKELAAFFKELPGLRKELLAYTRRDGTVVKDIFNTAYQGNYFELLYILAEVIRANGFFPLPVTLGNLLNSVDFQKLSKKVIGGMEKVLDEQSFGDGLPPPT